LQAADLAGFLFALAESFLLRHGKARSLPGLLVHVHGVPFSRPTILDDATRPGVAPMVTVILPELQKNQLHKSAVRS